MNYGVTHGGGGVWRIWKRIYIPVWPWRSGNYLLILSRRASIVVTLDLSPSLFRLLFSLKKSYLNDSGPIKDIPAGLMDTFCRSQLSLPFSSWILMPASTPEPAFWASSCARNHLAGCNKSTKRSRHANSLNQCNNINRGTMMGRLP